MCLLLLYAFCADEKFGEFYGDPHFKSFDGSRFDYQGTCEYTVTEYCNGSLDLDYFKVSADFASSVAWPGRSVCFSIRLDYREISYEIKGTDKIYVTVNEKEVATTYDDGAVNIANTRIDAFVSSFDFVIGICQVEYFT